MPPENAELLEFCQQMANSYKQFAHTELAGTTSSDLLPTLYHMNTVLLAHRISDDPIFCFANLQAQKLWEMDWETFTKTPSRMSAPEYARAERQTLLDATSEKNIYTNYCGVRISSTGKLFRINNATIWNIFNEEGAHIGQGACFNPDDLDWNPEVL